MAAPVSHVCTVVHVPDDDSGVAEDSLYSIKIICGRQSVIILEHPFINRPPKPLHGLGKWQHPLGMLSLFLERSLNSEIPGEIGLFRLDNFPGGKLDSPIVLQIVSVMANPSHSIHPALANYYQEHRMQFKSVLLLK